MAKERRAKQTDFTSGPIIKPLLLFSIPLVLGDLFNALYNVVDTIVVGQYVGAGALAAVGCCFAITMVCVSVFAGFGMGSGILTAQMVGAKREDQLTATVNTAYIGGFIVGGLQQVIVVFGVHHVFNALEVQLLATTGVDPFNAIITGAIVAQGGAAVAVALKTQDPKKRALYISSAAPALLGITEPAIFGINLRFMKPFLYALVGGACAGGVASFLHLAGTGMGITVLPGTLLYLDHLLEYVIVNLIGFGVAFALTFTLFKPEE